MNFGLPAKYYRDQSVFDRESRMVFGRSWLCLGRVAELANSDGYRTLNVEGRPLLLLLDGDRLRAFYNVCRHRQAILCSDDAGSLHNGCVQCPYHAWTYSTSGELVGAPNMQASESLGFRNEDFGLVEVASAIWNGFLMVNFGETVANFDDDYKDVLNTFEPWALERLEPRARLEYVVKANWKLLFQNYSECYHCPTVHPVLSRLTPYKSASNDLLAGAFLGGPMQLSDGVETMSLDGKAIAAPIPTLSSDQQRQVGYYTLFPTMFISPHPDYVMVHYLSRMATDQTRVSCELYFDPDLVIEESDIERAAGFWDQTNRQDWHVCELVQQGMAADLPPGPYSPLEPVLPLLDRHYLSVMGA